MSLVVVANREPLRREGDGWVPAVGGLATALLPVLERRGGVWVAWGEKDAGSLPLLHYPPAAPRFAVHRLFLPPREVAGSYHGMANRTLWPLAHYLLDRVEIRRDFSPPTGRPTAASPRPCSPCGTIPMSPSGCRTTT